ncbi:peptidase E [Candidatus Saccharibacteria bacterium]|nr:peptidase E [Candidatus Saccharibacteria bacterium]
MRLFLASQDFGDYVDRLKKLVGANRKVLIIQNSKDDWKPEARRTSLVNKMELLEKEGFKPTELDLRNYFNNNNLPAFIDKFKPGLILVTGGSPFMVSQAMRLSGLTKKLWQDLKQDKYVYAGFSAGAMAAALDLHPFDRLDRAVIVKDTYGVESDYKGLGLVNEYILPHADHADHTEIIKEREAAITAMGGGAIPIVLHDSDVFVVDGDKKEVLR